jgi:YidC/Oxa1 family membrane protein insertase
MEKRLLFALLLSVLVVVLTAKLFPTASIAPRPDTTARPGSSAAGAAAARASNASRQSQPAAESTVSSGQQASPSFYQLADTTTVAPVTTLDVATELSKYRFSTTGAAPVGVQLTRYRALGEGDGPVQLVRPGVPLLAFRLLIGSDTIPLERVPFAATHAVSGTVPAAPLTFQAHVDSLDVVVSYAFVPDSYTVRVTGGVRGRVPAGSAVEVMLPRGLRSQEADTADDQSHLAFVLKPTDGDVASIPFGKLDTARVRVEGGPFAWVATRNKYFITVLLTREGKAPFLVAGMEPWSPTGKRVTAADAGVVQPLDASGAFGFDVYAGPQEWRRLRAMGRDLEHVNPYGGFLRPVVEPFANIVMRVLLWMHEGFSLNYGWVLVIFGVVIRLFLWPLNQKSMRANIQMQRLQPELQEIQRKYKKQPEKQHTEMMKLYQKHGMSPFSMFSGCLPMLLPMPILFALYFVFLNTIEFRGVPFLWMADISQRDPFYILPILMGVSMFVMSWIGLRAAPKNPQSQMFAYVMPLAMTAIFFRFAAGLNLYYAVQNIAAIPQQWILARERKKAATR